MNNPYFIKFEKRKSELYLTISCIIENNSILNIQERLWKELREEFKEHKDIEFVEDINRLNQENNIKLIIYKYPKERIHFSLINLLTRNDIEYSKFEEIFELLKKDDTFKNIKNDIENIIEKNIKKKIIEGTIKRLYFPQKIEGSIALNISIDQKEWSSYLGSLESTIKKVLEKYCLDGEVKLKMHNDKYFAINLIRFINNKSDDSFAGLCRESSIYKKINEINKELEESFKSSFKTCFVISDPYLSNKDPFMSY